MGERRTMFGYDYGTRPITLVVGDTEFPNFLTSEQFVALIYDQVPDFGLLVNPPRLTMVFKDIKVGRKCFVLFKKWAGDTEDGDAIRISFIDLRDGSYGMCISQDVERLIKRMVPEIFRDEVELRIMNVGHIRTFPRQSEGYNWFKAAVDDSPFVLAFQQVNGAPLRELAMRKREILFFGEGAVPEHSIERSLIQGMDSKEGYEIHRKIPPEIRFANERVHDRRRKQMSTFFPVTLERLCFDRKFLAKKERLIAEGYTEWQIVQAACNISLQHIAPELFGTADEGPSSACTSIALNVLEFLLTHHEDLNRTLPPQKELTTANLRKQLDADARVLLEYATESDSKGIKRGELQTELEKRGLLTA